MNINQLKEDTLVVNREDGEKTGGIFDGKIYAFDIFYDFIKKNKVYFALYLFFILCAYPFESVVLPQFYSYFFDTIKKDQRVMTFIKYFLIFTTILIFTYTCGSLQHHMESVLLPEMNAHYLNYIYKNLLLKYKNQYTDLDMGEIITKMTNIPITMRELSGDFAAWVLPRILAILVINIYFFFIHWKLGLVSLIMICVFCIMNNSFVNKCVAYSTERQNETERKYSQITDKLSNLYSIYSAGDMKEEIAEYEKNTLGLMKKHRDAIQCVNKNKIINIVMMIVLFVVLNAYTTYLFKLGQVSYHNLVAVFITIIYYIPCFYNISESVPDIVHYIGVLRVSDGFLRDLINVDHDFTANKKPEIIVSRGEIDIRGLQFDYGGSRPIFDDFNLRIAGGDRVALMGESGNGKSTLIKIIMGYYHVDDSTIFVDGQDINSVDLDSLRKNICYVNQNSKLFNLSIYENIAYGNKVSIAEIDQMIARMGVGSIFTGLKNGLNTVVGVNGDQLSGGQKQMIHILRAMSKKNKIIIMDEPTAAIDVNHRDVVIRAIDNLSRGKTLILITHDNVLLKITNRTVRIANGRVVSDKKY
jgi:ABC-type bacteriocin/lantibiotic exporter with double-glycine peptidase domain